MGLGAPERYFSRISRIDVQKDLLDCGYTHALLDMDNTILSRKTHAVPRDVALWLRRCEAGGVRLCLVSNNWHESPYETGSELGIPVVAKAMKPLPQGFLAARGKIGARSGDTVVIGDQISTDVLGAHFLGMAAYLVCPLAEGHDLKHTRLVRAIERGLLGPRVPEGATASVHGAAAEAKAAPVERL